MEPGADPFENSDPDPPPQAPTYIRHALAAVAVANGKFYTLTTGANELRRWGKVGPLLRDVVKSFKVVDRFPAS